MKIHSKLLFSFLLVSILSAGIAVGVYSYLNRHNYQSVKDGFTQTGYHSVGLTVAAENTDFSLAAEQSVHAVVHIKSIVKPSQRDNRDYFDPYEFFFGTPRRQYQIQPKVGFGSGVIISTDGYIVTNNHVIDGADEIEVTMNDDQVYTAKLVGADEATDVALLKIEGKDFPVIPFGDSDALKVGEWVLAVGNPFNLTSTVTAGIVSAKGRASLFADGRGHRNQTQEKIESYIQTDAAVNPGNSGGALVNTRGELIGINTAIYSETGNYVGYSFAIPISIVKKVIVDIKQYGIVQRALLGVSVIDLPLLKREDPDKYNKVKAKDGVYVDGFSSKSSSEKAGIKAGDVIVKINDRKIHNLQELRAQLSRYNPGDKVDVQVQRDEELKTYKVELKNDQGTTEAITGKNVSEILGASLNEITLEKPVWGIQKGIKISALKEGKLQQAGVKENFIILMVNDENITSFRQLEKIVETLMKNEPENRGLFIKGIYPNNRISYYAINLDD